MASKPSVSDVLSPFPAECLGWFCAGYHISDAPGRAGTIREFLLRSGLVPEDAATLPAIEDTLNRVIRLAPAWITLEKKMTATVSPIFCNTAGAMLACARPQEWQPFNGKSTCTCGHRSVLWRSCDAVFLTFGMGMRRGQVCFLRCFKCN